MSQASVKDIAGIVLEDRPDAFVELMARELSISPEQFATVRPRLEEMHHHLRQTFIDRLEDILEDRHLDMIILTHLDCDHTQIAQIKQHFLNDLLENEPTPVCPVPLPPQLREWALRQHTEEEIVAGLQEAREQNGPELKEAVRRLEEELKDRERANP